MLLAVSAIKVGKALLAITRSLLPALLHCVIQFLFNLACFRIGEWLVVALDQVRIRLTVEKDDLFRL